MKKIIFKFQQFAAIQAATIILHGSKPFLSQAEQNDKPHPSYIPFSITLGDMIVSMYASIIQALSTEGSLPVLIQVLKCLASLVQVRSPNIFVRSDLIFYFNLRQLHSIA